MFEGGTIYILSWSVKMSYLEGKRVYLSGPIEHGQEDGDNWRIEPSKVLVQEFHVNLFDPFNDPKQQWLPFLTAARESRDYEQMATIAKPFVRKDLCMVDRSDFLIAYLPRGVPTCGTHHEIINSVNAKKPVLLVCPQGKEFVPFWYFGFIPHTQMFSNWGDLYQYLREVNDGKLRGDDRWHFVYGVI